ncbi:hypothetical protein BU23DRAFT_89154 [Bimuria novae-zelandiae CBS 107.79]|uniref:ATP-dependent protease-like protein n=1 Tax=Bimuria novae-zelandiae CBS 107.79 TaxID=1447943 RepID=A0A6A5VC23_9PLEO|nr:hypothetical protein BU23DRAFT_89154 [Bimuria novae-zelandiae CBS 107.79]
MNSQRRKELFLPRDGDQTFEPLIPPQALMVVEDVPSQEYSEKEALAAHGDARELVRLVQCPQCSKPFSTPVTLPCGHTVCRGCLPQPRARANISYPNTPDRIVGVTCPLSQCGAEHAAAECSVDVTLTKVMELIKVEMAKHIPLAENAPIHLKELVGRDSNPPMEEKQGSERMGNSRVLHGGRLLSTFAMAETGDLRYSSEVDYRTPSDSHADYQDLDNALLERLRDVVQKELDCLVCYNMMLDPTTTSCGHTFCRRCLVRVMDHSSICPMCRKGLHMPASLQNKPSNALLSALLNGLCPDLVAARQRAVEAEEHAADDDLTTPLFVCTLSLPAMPTFLHVFEPRYRLMMRRCVEGNKQFGMVMYNRNSAPQGDMGPTQFLEYGTLLEIVNLELLRDGRSFVETRGIGRFKIRAHGMLDGYHVARVERVEDLSLAEEGVLEQSETTVAREFAERYHHDNPDLPLPLDVAINQFSTQELLDNCMAFIRQMRNASAPWLSARIVSVYGEPPEDPALFPYWFASVVPIAEEEKYVLLQTTRVRERLKIVYSWIRRIRGQRWYVHNLFPEPIRGSRRGIHRCVATSPNRKDSRFERHSSAFWQCLQYLVTSCIPFHPRRRYRFLHACSAAQRIGSLPLLPPYISRPAPGPTKSPYHTCSLRLHI